MELHPYILDDPILLLQEHALHSAPVHLRLLLRLLGAIFLRWLVHQLVQSDLHFNSAHCQGSSGTRYQLCCQEGEHEYDGIGQHVNPNAYRNRPSNKTANRILTPRFLDKQIFLPPLPKNLLHRPIKLHLQLHKLLPLGHGGPPLKHPDHPLRALHCRQHVDQLSGI